MPSNQAAPAANRLLAALPRRDYERVLSSSQEVELVLADVIHRAGERMAHVYFPTASIVSVSMPGDGTAALEVGLVGSEGMLGITLMLEVDTSPFHALVQGGGSALQIEVPSFLRELERSPALQRKLKHYLYVSMSQLAQMTACTRFHVVEQRLARWLLMTQDRAHSDTFHVTHLFLAYVLGVRRVGITKAASSLQQRKLIRYHRGEITILDRAALEAASCNCYRVGEDTYARILGAPCS